MTPLALIESASSWRRVWSACARGWNWFGTSRSTSASVVGTRGAMPSGASGMSALSPLPRAGRLFMAHVSRRTRRAREIFLSCRGARQHFPSEREIGLGAAGFHVVEDHRHAVARRFAESNVARNDGPEDFFFEELAHVGGHLLAEVRALVEHRQQHA